MVDGYAPAGDGHPGLPGGHVDRAQPALAGGAVELEGDHLLPDHGVRAHAVHHAHPRGTAVRPLGHREVRRARPAGLAGATRSSRRRRPARGRRLSWVCRPASSERPASIASSSAGRQAGLELAAGGRDPDQQRRRAALDGLAHGGHDRHRVQAEGLDLAGGPAGLGGVDHRHHLARCRNGSRRAPSCPCAGRTAPRRRSRAARSCGHHPQTRPRARAAPGRRAAPAPSKGSSASSRWPSRSTQSASEAMAAAGAIASCDSTMQPSITCRPRARAAWIIRTASRRPPDFASLTLMASA